VDFSVIISELLKVRAMLKVRLLMICASDAASFSSSDRVLTFVRVLFTI